MLKQVLITLGVLLLVGCSSPSTPTKSAVEEPTIISLLPTLTPAPLTDPALAVLKKLLKQGIEKGDEGSLMGAISTLKWVGAIYRVGGTPPLDPMRGLTLTKKFTDENKVVVDIERPYYEPTWNNAPGDTAVLAWVVPRDGSAPYYSHLYIQKEPAAWRYTGILSRLPYYDAPSVAQIRSSPTKFVGREVFLHGSFSGREGRAPNSTPGSGLNSSKTPSVEEERFLLKTFDGDLWVARRNADFVPPLDPSYDGKIGQLMLVFGTIQVKNGEPFLASDSFQFVDPSTWTHVKGKITAVDASTPALKIESSGSGVSTIHLYETTFISKPDGSRGSSSDLQIGQTIDAVGQLDRGSDKITAEEIFVGS